MVPSDLFSDYDTVMCSIPLVSDPFQTFPNADYAGFPPFAKKYLKLYLPYLVYSTVFENHIKSLMQHCERSELRLHFKWTKVN